MAIPLLPTTVTQSISTLDARWKNTGLIRSQQTYLAACEALSGCQQLRREVTKHFTEVKRTAQDHLNAIRAMEKSRLSDLSPTEDRLQALIVAYEDYRADQAREAAANALKGPADAEIAVLTPDLRTPKGQYRRVTYRPVVEDFRLLLKAVVDGLVPMEALGANLPVLRQMIKDQGSLFAVPGVRVETDVTVVTRAE